MIFGYPVFNEPVIQSVEFGWMNGRTIEPGSASTCFPGFLRQVKRSYFNMYSFRYI